MYEGTSVALITPFTKDDKLDEEGYKNNISYVIGGGVSSIVVCGTTGESCTLSFEEHKKLIELAVEYSSVPVIAGTGANSTKEACELTSFAADAGADACLVVTPYYNKPNRAGLIRHLESIMSCADIPIILYNIPSRTCLNIDAELMYELSKYPSIIGVKEASGNIEQVSRIIELTKDEEFFVISGDDALNLPIMSLGGIGVISVAANVAPSLVSSLTSAMLNDNLDEAKKIHYKLMPLIRALFLETNPIPIKKACEMIGLAAGNLRLPLAELKHENQQILERELRRLALL
ncbi:MAG: 4-hydroxy-tetrahydrodipicolinate synthase [Methermicoccaceae archaeon]